LRVVLFALHDTLPKSNLRATQKTKNQSWFQGLARESVCEIARHFAGKRKMPQRRRGRVTLKKSLRKIIGEGFPLDSEIIRKGFAACGSGE
jgi:hypothetical protein